MSDMLLALLKSKRTWVTVLTIVAHLLAKHHVLLSDASVSDIADQIIIGVGAAGVIGTKILDSRKPDAPSTPAATPIK